METVIEKYNRECMRGHCVYLEWLGAGMFDEVSKFNWKAKKQEHKKKRFGSFALFKNPIRKSVRFEMAIKGYKRSKFQNILDFSKACFAQYGYKDYYGLYQSLLNRQRRKGL